MRRFNSFHMINGRTKDRGNKKNRAFSGPFVSINNSSSSGHDNQNLGVAGKIWYTTSSTTFENPNLPGYQSNDLPNSTIITSLGRSIYMSKTWHILGR